MKFYVPFTTTYLWGAGTSNPSDTNTVLSSKTSLTPTFTPTQSGNYLYNLFVTGDAACGTASDNILVTVSSGPTPTISAGGPTTFCSGGNVTLTCSAANSYSWSNGATTQSITISTSGTYTVTATDGSGCPGTKSQIVTVNANPSPTITAGGPTTFCSGGNVTLTSNAFSSYLWSSSETTQAITKSASGTYTVTVIDGNGCTGSASKVVTVNSNPTPTITAGGATTFCSGGSVTLTSSAASAYAWTGGATTASISATTSGNYFVTVTDGNGCTGVSAAKTVTVNPNPTPTITAGGATTFCSGGSVTLTSSAASAYAWTGGATTASISATTSGNYFVTVTDGNGCTGVSAATAVTINPNPTPTITAGGATTFCSGGSVTLTSSAASAYAWTGGATSASLSVLTSGNYFVTVTDGNGCTGVSAATTVTVNSNPSVALSKTDATCGNSDGTATATPSGGSGVYSYLWNNLATTQTINNLAAGNYDVTVTDANGCSATGTVSVNSIGGPTLSFTQTNVTCNGGNNGAIDLTVSGGTPGFSYSWSNGTTSEDISTLNAGSYDVTVSDNNSCIATTSVTITQSAALTPTITAGGSTTFCSGGNVTLTSNAFSSYSWSSGETTQGITKSASGTYTVTVTDGSGCTGTASQVVTVNPNPIPTITAGGVTTFCSGGSVTLTSSAASAYAWTGGATTSSISATT
ncbi:MAG: SprB repeat-containing protein, partial [Bacteroidetes bacterium]|nr:SprB repeat-containing protein [Bacteroidota bacterium]